MTIVIKITQSTLLHCSLLLWTTRNSREKWKLLAHLSDVATVVGTVWCQFRRKFVVERWAKSEGWASVDSVSLTLNASSYQRIHQHSNHHHNNPSPQCRHANQSRSIYYTSTHQHIERSHIGTPFNWQFWTRCHLDISVSQHMCPFVCSRKVVSVVCLWSHMDWHVNSAWYESHSIAEHVAESKSQDTKTLLLPSSQKCWFC
jgi:hypothetical protein